MDVTTQLCKTPGEEALEVDAPTAGRPTRLIPILGVVALAVAAALYSFARPRPLAETITAKSGEMVLVPAGPFKFGQNKEDITLPAYYIDRTEVTNEAYAVFIKETRYAPPSSDFAFLPPNFPVVNVSIDDAKAFAKWAGKRLPPAREWEKAARGTDGRLFPWGNVADLSRANIDSEGPRGVDDFPNGASPFGVLNMVGNISEWLDGQTAPGPEDLDQMSTYVDPPLEPGEAWYAVRGAAFNSSGLGENVLWEDKKVPRRYVDANLGFRCAKTAH